ncbi:beta-glucosidase, glycoside hydrolase family 3 protein [Rhodotorula toruloides]|uniref:Probable beta-glucosidase G n=2 Tax=Rhodotorula toruloides TaxID=5286 RepID=A0A0K3C404_RHOTO|nr:beta-glucosidase, glycoside hydrolase family 3 protein [Rhodotorula toruloides]
MSPPFTLVLVALFAYLNASTAHAASSAHASKIGTLTAHGFTDEKWIKGFEMAKAVVAGMSLEQKVNFTGLWLTSTGCSGQTRPIEGKVPMLCFADTPTGVNSRYSTQFPAGVTTIATWSRDLISRRADAMGHEFSLVGAHTPMAIVAGPMGRSVFDGRTWEGFGVDPYMSGVATALSVEGFQKNGVSGMIKHYFGNEQEYLRIGVAGGYFPSNKDTTISSNIDAATVHEEYLWPFAEGVRAGAGHIMSSYNKLNGTLASESCHALVDLLKVELNAHSAVVSDWGAAYDTVEAAKNGLDFVEGGAPASNIFGGALGAAIKNGTLPKDIIDDKIVRMLTPYFALDQKKLPAVNIQRKILNKKSTQVVLDIAEESITLLKNARTKKDKRGLPLEKPSDILIVGPQAVPGPYGITSNFASAFFALPTNDYNGTITNGLGSGGSPAPYVVDPLTGISERARKQDPPAYVDWYYSSDTSAGVDLGFGFATKFLDAKISSSGQVVVFASTMAMEGYDRDASLKLSNGADEMIKYVAARHKDVIVVVSAPGPVAMDWASHANISAILYTYFPTTEAGTAIASVLFGDVSPSGKLPSTLANKVSDYPLNKYDGPIKSNPVAKFSEGVFLDYKHFEQKGIKPLYPYGFGMTYTSFSLSDFSILRTPKHRKAAVRETNERLFVAGKAVSGLYDVAYTARVKVHNTGKVAGAEVPQLYLTFPSSTPRKMPAHSLRGFDKVHLKPGHSATVTFELRNKDLAVWDVKRQGWTIPKGMYKVSVGTDSSTLPLSKTFVY